MFRTVPDTYSKVAAAKERPHRASSANNAISALPSSQIMQLQRTVGNRRIGEMLGLAPSVGLGGRTIQRSLGDTVKVTWSQSELSKLWVKMRDRSEGKDQMPNFDSKFKPAEGDAEVTPKEILTQLVADLNDEKLTERELAEKIIEHPQIKPLYLNPRLRQTKDVPSIGDATGDAAIEAVIKACLFYHVTFERNVEAIRTGGLKASKGGSGTGVSTFGRDDKTAQSTYNKWSKGHTFITKLVSEAQGYKAKMEKEEPARIIHVFSTPYFTMNEGKVDIDSKAGLKFEGDLNAIGDGTTLNENAKKVLLHAFVDLPIKPTADDIQRVYTASYG